MEFSFPSDPLDELRRLYRQACVHQLANETAVAADILQNVLPDRVSRLQAAEPGERWQTETLQAVFAEEYRRVADAHVLGELMLPRLQRGLAPAPFPVASSNAVPAAPSTSAARTAPGAAAPAASASSTITDMLDSMLAQDGSRTARR